MPNEAFGWRAVVVLFGVLVGCVAALPWLVALGLVAMLPVLPVIGAYVYKLTILMHECCHRTLFRARSTNDRIGLVCGGFLVSSYDGFCRAHWQHHRHCGTDEDGEESDYLKLQDASARSCWCTWSSPCSASRPGAWRWRRSPRWRAGSA